MNVMNTTLLHEYQQEFADVKATNYFGVASYVVLLYDHILTFDDEVQYIWGRKKKIVSWLFLINRYVTALGFAVNINAYTSPKWTPVVCDHFVPYEGWMTLIGISVASLLMGIRVSAIYFGNRVVKGGLALIFLVMVGVDAWLMTTGEAVHHPTGIHGCSMIFGRQTGNWASAAAWLPLLYDTVVVVLVIARTRGIFRVNIAGQMHVVNTLIHDGLMYYSVILASSLVLAIMISTSHDGLKNICGQFQLLITVTMMSRITLNLRKNMERLGVSAGCNIAPSCESSLERNLPADSQSSYADGRVNTDLEVIILDIRPGPSRGDTHMKRSK